MLSTTWNILRRRDLLYELVLAEVRTATAGRALGWLWWILDPLLMMFIYWFVVGVLLGRQGGGLYHPYWLFVFCGLIVWKHIAGAMGQSAVALIQGYSLIRSVPFPTAILPLSRACSGFFFFLLGFLVFVLMRSMVDVSSWTGTPLALVQIPILMAFQMGIVAALALPTAAIGAAYRDVSNLIGHALRIGFYLSPCLYGAEWMRDSAISRFGEATGEVVFKLYMLNPFAIIIEGYRAAVLNGTFLAPEHWGVLGAETVAFLLVGYWIYHHYDRRVVKFL